MNPKGAPPDWQSVANASSPPEMCTHSITQRRSLSLMGSAQCLTTQTNHYKKSSSHTISRQVLRGSLRRSATQKKHHRKARDATFSRQRTHSSFVASAGSQ